MTPDGKTLIAIDTLNRVRVSDFPNVFNIRHMILQHKNRITDYTFLGSDRLATYSSLDNHLLITDLNSGAILFNEKKPADPAAIVEGLTETKDS